MIKKQQIILLCYAQVEFNKNKVIIEKYTLNFRIQRRAIFIFILCAKLQNLEKHGLQENQKKKKEKPSKTKFGTKDAELSKTKNSINW